MGCLGLESVKIQPYRLPPHFKGHTKKTVHLKFVYSVSNMAAESVYGCIYQSFCSEAIRKRFVNFV